MKKTLILVVCTLLLALLPWTMESAAQEPQVFYLPLVFAPSQLSQMELAFVSAQDGDAEIYVMKGDGSGRVQLTHNSAPESEQAFLAIDEDPDWSPDGRKIAFVSYRDGNPEIYVMDADGSNQTRITNETAPDSSPKWSPDGNRIAFVSERDGYPHIYLMNPDGSNPIQLTEDTRPEVDLAWSPDGQWLAVSQQGELLQWSLLKIKLDGSEILTLWTADSYVGIHGLDRPAGGEKIYFDFSYQGLFEGYRIYSIFADGSQSEPVFLSDGASPAWAPDGQFVAIVYRTGGTIIGFTPHIAMLTPDGSFYKEVTGTDDQGYQPDWSPVIGVQ